MRSDQGIARYIGIQASILVAVLAIIYSVTVVKVYDWGLDDSTHYFLSLEANHVKTQLGLTGKLPPEPNAYNRYYLSESQLPVDYKTVFPAEQHADETLLVAKIGGDTVYLMPFSHPESGQLAYVAHHYRQSDDFYDVGLDIPELLLLLGLLTLAIALLLVRNLAWPIIKPVTLLETWAASINTGNSRRLPAGEQLKFVELQTVAEKLDSAVAAIESRNQREKNFLRTLSHELRTPLAVIHAALDLFDQNEQGLTPSHLRKLARMRRANNNMRSTTECLLWLWAEKERPMAQQDVSLRPLIEDIAATHQYLLKQKNVEWTVDVPNNEILHIEKGLLEMLLTNLIRNAFQYTDQGKVTISANHREVIVTNPLPQQPVQPAKAIAASSTHTESHDYGYGIGLYLVETLCSQKNWLLDITSDKNSFSVRVSFSDTCRPL